MAMVSGAGGTSSVRWKRRWSERTGVRGRRPARSFADAMANLPAAATPAGEHGEPEARPAAAFIAQVLAARLDMPQARRRRRAEADEAEASYHANDPAARPTGSGAIVRREA